MYHFDTYASHLHYEYRLYSIQKAGFAHVAVQGMGKIRPRDQELDGGVMQLNAPTPFWLGKQEETIAEDIG